MMINTQSIAASSPPVTLCACGCGQPAAIAKQTRRSHGYVKGQPCRYIRGHTRRTRPKVARTPCTAAPAGSLARAMVDDIGRRFGLADGQIYQRTRVLPIPQARQAAMWALKQIGFSIRAISRMLDLDWKTVQHGVARAEQRADWQDLVRPALDLQGAGGQHLTLAAWLDQKLPAELSAADRGAVHAYATCTLLGWEQLPSRRCVHGMMLVLHDARIRAALEEALLRSELEMHIERIRWHAARLAVRGVG